MDDELDALRRFVGERLAPTGMWTELGGGTTARLWRATLDDGRTVAIKRCGPGRAFAQEHAALTAVAGLGDRVPHCLAAAPELRALVLSWVPGAPASTIAPTPAIWRAAGALRAAFDTIACVEDPMPLQLALDRRMHHWRRRGEAVLASDERTAIDTGWQPEVFATARRSFAHRDFTPRNWLVDDGRLACVDFGHARDDHWLRDLVSASWPPGDRPELRAAFVAGWGIAWTEAVERELAQLRLQHALATCVWARQRGDDRLAAEARTILLRRGD